MSDQANAQWGLLDELQFALKEALRKYERGDSLNIQDVLREADALLTKARASGEGAAIVDQSARELLAAYWDTVTRRRACSPTGFKTLDTAMGGGFESKRLVVVLGAPNCGKTTFVHQVADHIANSGRPVLYVTSEDPPHDLIAKTLARVGGVDYTAVKKGWETERTKINAAIRMQAERTSSDCLHYLDAVSGMTLDTIRGFAQAHFAHYPEQGGQGLIVIDYLQRMARAIRLRAAMSQDLREAVTMLTEQLRALACELDCCVIAVASQNRASGYNASNNTLASAKESGDVEYTADVILTLGDESDRKASASFVKPMVLKIDKNRLGERDKKIALDFQPDRQQFTEAATGR